MDSPLYNQTPSGGLMALITDRHGLQATEAKRRLKQYGTNELQPPKPHLFRRLVEPFSSLFVIVMLIGVGISLITQEHFDAVIIGSLVVFNAVIYYVQQFSVEHALRTLRQADVSQIRVRRDDTVMLIDSKLLVPGDIVLLNEGMKIPADGRLLEAEQLKVDEAMLTGESLPVTKTTDALRGQKEIYDQHNMVFKGTIVRSGLGECIVSHTGNQTVLGQITSLTEAADLNKSPIEIKIDALTRNLVLVVGALGIGIFGLALLRHISVAEGLRFSMSLVVSIVPEGLPVALTVVLFIGAKRMAKARVLIKNMAAIETLGAITLIATDKTGTLTRNHLTVEAMSFPKLDQSEFLGVVRGSLNGNGNDHADVLDHVLHRDLLAGHQIFKYQKIKEYPFDQKLRVSGCLWQNGSRYWLCLKGAPEAFRVKARYPELTSTLTHYTSDGFRAIAFGHVSLSTKPGLLNANLLKNLTVDGLIGLADPLRPGIPQSVSQAKMAGISVVMLTGDHKATAAHIAQRAGIATAAAEAQEGKILADYPASHIRKILSTVKVFARVLPEHKYYILKSVKGHEVTAMTGDGVNDIPALAEADVGIAMGSGSDAAKDASDLVLLHNSFAGILTAIRLGRSIIANIRKMLFYLFSTSLGEAITMLGALMFNFPLPVTAVQILWINLVTDGFTVLPLGIGKPEPNQMHKPPASPKASLLGGVISSRLILIGLSMAILSLFFFNLYLEKGHAYAQTIVFVVLVVCQWANTLNANFEHKSWVYNFIKPNHWLFIGLFVSLLLQLVALYSPLRHYFGVVSVQAIDLVIAGGISVLCTLVLGDAHKLITWLYQRHQKSIVVAA